MLSCSLYTGCLRKSVKRKVIVVNTRLYLLTPTLKLKQWMKVIEKILKITVCTNYRLETFCDTLLFGGRISSVMPSKVCQSLRVRFNPFENPTGKKSHMFRSELQCSHSLTCSKEPFSVPRDDTVLKGVLQSAKYIRNSTWMSDILHEPVSLDHPMVSCLGHELLCQ